jgi:signal peptidase II
MQHIIAFFVFIVLLSLDLLSKYFFYNQQWLAEYTLITPYLNTGIARSLPVASWIVFSVTIIAIILLGYWYITEQMAKRIIVILVAGIIGNAYDRVVFQGVRDFIDLGRFPIFNIADIAISV